MTKSGARVQTRPWYIVEHLSSEVQMAAYLAAALEDGDPAVISTAMEDIAQARAIAE